MEEGDVEKAAALEAKTFSMPWKAGDFLEMINAEYAYYFVAVQEQEIVGIIGLRDILGEGEITNVAVEETHRRKGIARQLLDRVIKRAQELGIKALTLEVRRSNVAAISLYESFGFEIEGVRPHFYDKPTEDALIMWARNL